MGVGRSIQKVELHSPLLTPKPPIAAPEPLTSFD